MLFCRINKSEMISVLMRGKWGVRCSSGTGKVFIFFFYPNYFFGLLSMLFETCFLLFVTKVDRYTGDMTEKEKCWHLKLKYDWI